MIKEQDDVKRAAAVPPYLPYRTLTGFLDRLRAGGLPNRIDRSLMTSLSGTAQVRLMAALKYLGLIEANNHPSPELISLLNSEGVERQHALHVVLTKAYPKFFEKGFRLEAVTAHELEDAFKEAGASGGTVGKCIAFFTAAAKDAGVTVSSYISRGTRTRTSGTRRRAPGTNGGAAAEGAETTATAPPLKWKQMLLSKFPSFDPAWPDDVKTKWFEAFDKLMDRGGDEPSGE